MNKIEDTFCDEDIAHSVIYEEVDIFQDFNKICVMVIDKWWWSDCCLFKHRKFEMYTECYCTSVKDWHMKKPHIFFDANNIFSFEP